MLSDSKGHNLFSLPTDDDDPNCRAIFNEGDNAHAKYPVPVLQCLQVKALPSPPGQQPERFRIVVSDGRHFTYGMLATQSNHVVRDGRLTRNSLVRIKSYQANAVKGKKSV